jgi:hypothetical protein
MSTLFTASLVSQEKYKYTELVYYFGILPIVSSLVIVIMYHKVPPQKSFEIFEYFCLRGVQSKLSGFPDTH